MKTSTRGINDLIASEGVVTRAYRDSVGVWTIGVGHTASAGSPAPKAGMTITRDEAFAILRRDLAKFEKRVRAALGPVPQHVFDGAVSFDFNTGRIHNASWVRAYKAGDMKRARANFMLYRHPPEIIGRRTREAELIFEGRYHTGPATGVKDTRNPPSRSTSREAVMLYQGQLAALGYDVGPVDGVAGPRTIAAVKAFQRDHDLVVDGIVGPATRATLANAMHAAKQPVVPPETAPATSEPASPVTGETEAPRRLWPLIAVGIVAAVMIAIAILT